MSILVDDSNKTACRAAEAGLQQKNCAALVRPAGTGKGCIVWELLDAHPEMRVLWVVSCAARLELRRALTKRLGRTLGGRVRLMSCEQLAVQNALGWVALAEFRPGLLVLDGWREMSAKDWTDCVQPLFRLCPGAKLLALGETDAPTAAALPRRFWPTPSWSRWRWVGRWPRVCCPCRPPIRPCSGRWKMRWPASVLR